MEAKIKITLESELNGMEPSKNVFDGHSALFAIINDKGVDSGIVGDASLTEVTMLLSSAVTATKTALDKMGIPSLLTKTVIDAAVLAGMCHEPTTEEYHCSRSKVGE